MRNLQLLVLLLLVYCTHHTVTEATPIVLWHGMGDSCCFPFSMGKIEALLREHVAKDVYIHSIRIGKNVQEDVWFSYFKNANEQIARACDDLRNDTRLSAGFHAIGFSQGSLFLRAFVERCNFPRVKNLISIGGMHQGVFGFPRCPGVNHTVCEYIRRLLDIGVYWSWVQRTLVQAEYWHDPLHEDIYRSKCIFLPDINNEVTVNETYKQNLMSLQKLVLVKFLNDTMVQPTESSWFGYYSPGQDREVQTMRQTDLYKLDKLGLKEMDEQRKLVFLATEGEHLQFTKEWFIENIVPFLKE